MQFGRMRGDFGIGVEGIGKEMNLGNLFRSAQAKPGGRERAAAGTR